MTQSSRPGAEAASQAARRACAALSLVVLAGSGATVAAATSTLTRSPRTPPPRCAVIPQEVINTFEIEGPSPYMADNCSMVFDALNTQYLSPDGSGWRHEVKIPTHMRTGMTRVTELFEADIRVDMSKGGKTIVTQYHAEGTGTIMKVYVSDNSESGFFNSTANDGVFDVYARILPAGSTTEQKMALGTITTGQTFRLSVSDVLGRVSVSAFGRTMVSNVDDGGASYLKFGNYLQSQDPVTRTSCKPFAECYAQFGIVESKVTMRNVVFSREIAPAPVPVPSSAPAPVVEWKFEDLAFPSVISTANAAYTLKETLIPSSTTATRDVFSSVTGPSGKALMMTQDSSRANYPLIKSGTGDYSFASTPGMSVEMWIKPSGHSATKTDTLVSKGTGTVTGCAYNSSSSGYSLKLNTNGTLAFGINGTTVTSTTAAPDHVWSHVVATYDKTEMKIYVNGALAATRSYTANIVDSVASSTGPTNVECSNLKVGGSTTSASSDTGNFQGQMDEFRMYDVGLTAGQVSSRYAAF